MAVMPDMNVKLKVATEFAEALVIRPGDTLVLRVARNISAAEADRARQRIRDELPGLAAVVILTGFDQLAAYRPDGDAAR